MAPRRQAAWWPPDRWTKGIQRIAARPIDRGRSFVFRSVRLVVLLLTAWVTVAAPTRAGGDGEDPFPRDVAPVLQRRCLSCHDDRQRKGGLSLQSAESSLRGGESGAVIEPGDPDASYLMDLITPYEAGRAEMPKNADALKPAEVAAIRKWIADGAKWPEGYRLTESQVADWDWWSLRPLKRPELPALPEEETDWLRSPVDAFVRARQIEHGLRPAPEADRRTLIRRLYYDLTGLPPSPEQVRAFVSSDDPLAYEKLVDRLLASPAHGERWARHWLDVVHYADTHGYDKDKLRENAWPYRDYVIRAFNEDKPYDRFVREQLAGDTLFPGTTDGPVATGFIACGPWDFIGHAEVPETKIDGQVARNLDRDDMVSTTMNVFVSTTVQCARCHNHKFDPITQENYYSMQAIFAAIDRAERPYDPDPRIAARRAELRRELGRAESALAAANGRIEESKPHELKQLEATLTELARAAGPEPANGAIPRSVAYGYHSAMVDGPNHEKWVQVDLGASIVVDHVLLTGASEYGWSDFGFPVRFRVETSDDPNFEVRRLLRDETAADFPPPGNRTVVIDGDGARGRYVRVTVNKLRQRSRRGGPGDGNWFFALGELTVLSDNRRVEVIDVTAADSIEATPRWGRENLVDGVFGTHSLDDRIASQASGSDTNGYHSQFAAEADTIKWVQLDLGRSLPIDSVRLMPAYPTDWPDTAGFGFPVRFRVELADDPEFSSAMAVADYTQSDFLNPGNRPVRIPATGQDARYVRLTATRLWDRGEAQHALALAEIEVTSQGENVAVGSAVTSSDSIDSGRWHTRYLTDERTSRRKLGGSADEWLNAMGSKRDEEEIRSLERRIEQLTRESIDTDMLAERARHQQRVSSVTRELDQLPAPRQVYGGTVHRGSGAFRGRKGLGPREIRVLQRGDVTKPGPSVGPGVFALSKEDPWRFDLPAEHEEGRRRAELARWLTDAENPLTWRSIVNRLWLYHFGRGIVDSPNDFGRMGQKPTHPELLDWLAAEFRDGCGRPGASARSFKSLHRQILLSATYRQAVIVDPKQSETDAENRFLWRMNRRRLDAESVRDTVLSVCDGLDDRMYGPGFRDFVIEQPEHSPHYLYSKHDPDDPATHRRSVYRFLVRSQQQPFMETLDCADPSQMVAKRNETLTALQALTMLNNKFMLAMSARFARRLERDAADLPSRLDLAYRLTLGRSPTAQESRELSEYARRHGLAGACRLIFNLNEFMFVD